MKRNGAADTALDPMRSMRKESVAAFLTIEQVSEKLRVCEQTVRRWTEQKKLSAYRFGGAARIGPGDLIQFVTRARRGATSLQSRNPLEEKFYTAEDVVEILNVCMRTVRRHIKSKCLASHKFGRIVRISGSDLQDFIDRSRGE